MTQALTQPDALAGTIGDRATDASQMVIKAANLVKVFKDFWLRNRVVAVGQTRGDAGAKQYEGIDFEVYRGEVFGLLGPNGSGKSTTIKMILGLLNPTSGRIAVLGKPPTDVSIKQRIGYLPEESYLYRFLNARETLDYYGRLFHQNRRQRIKRIDMLLEMVGLDKVQRRPIGEYSKGMQRRIGLAQALINDPELLILDEPTTGLDPIGTRQVKDLIVDLARPRQGKPGKTILLCSHLLSDVEDVCDRVAIMFGGRIRQYGTVDSLLTQDGKTTIETPELSAQAIQEIEEVLTRHGAHIDRVQRPRQKLEQLFLDIVNRAIAEGQATSGAGAGGRTAAFLMGEGEERTTGEAVIDQLVAGNEPTASTAPATGRAEPTPAPAGPAPARPATPPAAAQRPATPTPAPPPSTGEPAADTSVIEGLLGGDQPAPPPPAAALDTPRQGLAPTPAPAPPPVRPAPPSPPSPAARGNTPEPREEEQPDTSFLETLIRVEEQEREDGDAPKKG